MPNGYDYGEQRHGPHDYGDEPGTHDCKHECGCWMGPSRSGGPAGVDQFDECPGNPLPGMSLGNLAANTDFVITRRVRGILARMNTAEDRVRRTSKTKTKLAERIRELELENSNLMNTLYQIGRLLPPEAKRD